MRSLMPRQESVGICKRSYFKSESCATLHAPISVNYITYTYKCVRPLDGFSPTLYLIDIAAFTTCDGWQMDQYAK